MSERDRLTVWVGDLDKTITEERIVEHLQKQKSGVELTCFIPRRFPPKGQTLYAYVNVPKEQDRDDLIEKANYTSMPGNTRPIRLIPKGLTPDRLPSDSDLYITNIPQKLEDKTLYDYFKKLGFKPISCKVIHQDPTSETSEARVGFVQFRTSEEAKAALDATNEQDFEGNKLNVQIFIPAEKRPHTRCNLQLLPLNTTEEDIKQMVSPIGVPVKIALKQFPKKETLSGLVQFDNEELAKQCIEQLDGHQLSETKTNETGVKITMYYYRAERLKHNREKFKSMQERTLFISAIPTGYDDEKLQAICKQYGELQSCKMGRSEDGITLRPFAFCTYVKSEDARIARTQLEAPLPDGTKLKVDTLKTPEERLRFKPHTAIQRAPTKSRGPAQHRTQTTQDPNQMGPDFYRWMSAWMGGMPGYPPNPFYGQMYNAAYNAQRSTSYGPAVPPNPVPPQAQQPYGSAVTSQAQQPYPSALASNSVQTQAQQPYGSAVPPASVPSQPQAFNLQNLSSLPTDQDKKQYIGEFIFVKVQNFDSPNAGKITGMLLELPIEELIRLLNDDRELQRRVHEAQNVLQTQNP